MKTSLQDENRFENDASRYAAYLNTPEGRLRTDLTFANLQELLPALSETNSPHALDLGGGTGINSVRLAGLGYQVTMLDSSSAMLDLAERNALEAGLSEKIAVTRADAGRVGEILQP